MKDPRVALASFVGNPSRDELMIRLQSLLEERFHQVHHENREMSMFALTVAKNGPIRLLRGFCS